MGSRLESGFAFNCHISLGFFNLEHFHSLSLSFIKWTEILTKILVKFWTFLTFYKTKPKKAPKQPNS